jgi:hypothetical protein
MAAEPVKPEMIYQLAVDRTAGLAAQHAQPAGIEDPLDESASIRLGLLVKAQCTGGWSISKGAH